MLNELVCQSDLVDPPELKCLLKIAVPEYQPQLTIQPALEPKAEVRRDQAEVAAEPDIPAVDFVTPTQGVTA
jgi:hypothetical protein